MTYSLTNKCAKNYYNRTFIVPVIAKNVVTCFFLRHSVVLLRLQDVHKHVDYLLDYYIFSPEDIELNKKALTWPKNINPIFDQNDEVRTLLLLSIPVNK